MKRFFVLLYVLAAACSAEAALPALSISRVPPASVQFSWPSNFIDWQLMSTTNLSAPNWLAVTQAPAFSGNALVVLFPFTNTSGFFRLQQTNSGGGGCVFQAAPPQITAGASSSLTWCPVAGTTYRVTPGPGIVTGGNLTVSPTVTTVYTLTASNTLGVVTNFTTVIVNPCGWLQVSNWDATLIFSYQLSPSTASYNFNINHSARVTFHLMLQFATATDAYYFGSPVSDPSNDQAQMNDLEDDKTGPKVFTTTEVGGTAPPSNASSLSLHITCTTYDFTYNVGMTETETTQFGTDPPSLDGVGTGAIATRPLSTLTGDIDDSAQVPAEYPPSTADFFTPSSALGKAMFNTGTVTSGAAGNANVSWTFTPVP